MAAAPEDISDQLRQLAISESNVEVLQGEDLGRGAYGRVFKVRYRGSIYAAKEIHSILVEAAHTQAVRRRLQDSFIRECHYCSKFNHPNIVHFVGIYQPPQQLLPVMIMELMDESLTSYAVKPNISFQRRVAILYDVAEGLGYLHSHSIIHRDLSPNNVLLKHLPLLPVAKIADLGVARMLNVDATSRQYLSKAPGTLHFMPPEALQDRAKYGTSLDVFSYGGIMLHTVNGEWPKPTDLTAFDPQTRRPKAFTEVERRQGLLDKLTGEAAILRPLVEDCLDNDPDKRPKILNLSKRIKPLKESPVLGPALLSGCYELTWEKCADLPSPLYDASVALHDKKVYLMAGVAPDDDTLDPVFNYDINDNYWGTLPPPGQFKGALVMINNYLTVIGGRDNATKKITNKVTTFINNEWINIHPNMIKARLRPGVVTHLDYVIVTGGILDDDTASDDIELLNYKHSFHWVIVRMKLPKPMTTPSLTISNDLLYIVGYTKASGRATGSYQLPVDIIKSSTSPPLTSDQTTQWKRLPNAPHGSTTTIPNTCPPIIIGGIDRQYVPTTDVSVLDNEWKTIASLTTPKAATAILPISHDSILVMGGYRGGKGVEEAKANSITAVEKGTVTLSQFC